MKKLHKNIFCISATILCAFGLSSCFGDNDGGSVEDTQPSLKAEVSTTSAYTYLDVAEFDFYVYAKNMPNKTADMVEWHASESDAVFTSSIFQTTSDYTRWRLSFTSIGTYHVYATLDDFQTNPTEITVKQGSSIKFDEDSYSYEVRTAVKLPYHWLGASTTHYKEGFTFDLTNNDANAHIDWVKASSGNTVDAYITGENAGSVDLQINYRYSSGNTIVTAKSNKVKFIFNDNNDYSIIFVDTDGKTILMNKIHKYDEAISVPTIIDSNFVGWSNGTEVLSLNSEVKISKDVIYYAVSKVNSYSDGLKFETTENGYKVTGYSGYDFEVVVPSHYNGQPVIAIADNAFKGKSITGITLPYTIESIGSYAFSQSSIKYCHFNAGSLLKTISSYAFYKCSSLEYVILGEGLKSIGGYCFDYCNNLVIMFACNDISPISKGNYWNDNNRPYYTEVIIDYGEDSTGMYDCVMFKGITIGIRKYKDSSISTDLTIDKVDGYDVSHLIYNAYNTTGVKTVKISSSVVAIGNYAFNGCSSLISVDFEDATSLVKIGSYAFANCTGLVSVNLKPAINLTTINSYAFYKDTNLEDILIPTSVTSIGAYCFDYCSTLRILFCGNTDSISFGNYWNDNGRPVYKDISSVVQLDSTGLFKYYVSNSNKVGILFYRQPADTEKTEVDLTKKIDGKNVGYICYRAFSGSNITKITIPSSVETIGNYAFNECTSLAEYNIMDGSELTSIGSYAFYKCSKLIAVKVPKNVTSIGSYCFDYCSALNILFEAMDKSEISFGNYWNDNDRPCYYAVKALHYENFNVNGSFYYFETYRGTLGFLKWIGLTNDCGPTNDISITSLNVSGQNMPFTEICSYAFSSRKSYDGSGPFDWVHALTNIKITIGASVETIGAYAFYNLYTDSIYGALYSSDTNFKIVFEKNSNIKSIGKYAFCSSHLEGDVILGKQLESVGDYAFGLSSYISNSYKIWIEKGDKSGVLLGSTWNGKRTVYWGTEWEYNDQGYPQLKA